MNTNKYVGFIRLGSPVINCKPRNELLGQVPELTTFNRTTVMGFTIVPCQPFDTIILVVNFSPPYVVLMK